MKKTNLLKSMLLLCALVAGSGSVWADDYYVQVTDVDDLSTDATYIIGDYTSSTLRVMGELNASNRGTIISSDISISGTTITVSKDAENKPLEYSLQKSGDNYMITYGATPTYLGYNSGTAFETKTTAPVAGDGNKYFWTIEYNDTYSCLLITSVKATDRIILRNGTSAFSAYSNKNLGTYGKATLYKKVVPATINPTYEWATFSSSCALDFEGISTLSAYRASSVSASSVTLTQVTGTCAANTGLLLNGATTNIPVAASGTSFTSSENKLVAVSSAKTLTSADKAYVLTADGGGNVFFGKVGATSANIAAGQAYLDGTDIYANELTFDFANGDVTGINEVKEQKAGFLGDFYNLAGQRVTSPGKGMYIVNGKKVIIK